MMDSITEGDIVSKPSPDKSVDLNESCIQEENKEELITIVNEVKDETGNATVPQVEIQINDPEPEHVVENSLSWSVDLEPQIKVNKPLCADYRSGSDSDSEDSDSDSSSSSSSTLSSDGDDDDMSEIIENRRSGKACKTDLSLADLPPIENLKITVPEDECQEFGVVSGIVDTLVVIESFKGVPTLDIDTVLFLDKGNKSLGRIFDVLGPVSEPVYTVRFNKEKEIIDNNITKGMVVYCAPKTEYTSFVFVSELMKIKGSDASWKDNIEPPLECQDFSDDEEEQKFRQQIRKNGESNGASEDKGRKKVKIRHPKFNPPQKNTLSYRNPAAGSPRSHPPRFPQHPPRYPPGDHSRHPPRFPGPPFAGQPPNTHSPYPHAPPPHGMYGMNQYPSEQSYYPGRMPGPYGYPPGPGYYPHQGYYPQQWYQHYQQYYPPQPQPHQNAPAGEGTPSGTHPPARIFGTNIEPSKR